jgi:hypothetical protein
MQNLASRRHHDPAPTSQAKYEQRFGDTEATSDKSAGASPESTYGLKPWVGRHPNIALKASLNLAAHRQIAWRLELNSRQHPFAAYLFNHLVGR